MIDDGSPDDTFEIARRFLDGHAGRFRRIVLERRENRGVSANSNACIEACHCEWVHLLGSDDRLYPEKVAKIQSAIANWNCPELALVHTDTIDADGVIRPVRRPGLHADAGVNHAAYRWLFHRNLISNPSIALRRDAFLAIGGFDPALPLEDIDCWLRLSARHAIARLPETLASYRKHPGNSLRQRRKMLGAFFLTYAKFVELHPGLIDDATLRRHFRRNLRRYWTRIRDEGRGKLPAVVASFLGSYLRTPGAEDYRRFGRELLSAAS